MARQAVRAIILNGDRLLAVKRDKFGRQYYTLVGGGVKIGEDPEAALRRELHEETGLEIGAVREVFTEDGGDLYGVQHIFLCEYRGGEPVLRPDSDEAQINALGQNIYEPLWLPLADLPKVPFRSTSVAKAITAALAHGAFPETPQILVFEPERVPK